MADVRDVDLQRVMAVFQPVHPNGIIEIAGGFAVDCDDFERAKIPAAGELSLWDRPRKRARLFEHVIGKLVRDVVRADQNLDVDTKIVGPAQNLNDAADGTLPVVAIVEDLGGDDHAVQILHRFRIASPRPDAMGGNVRLGPLVSFWNQNPLADAVVVRNHEVPLLADVKLPDHRRVRAA